MAWKQKIKGLLNTKDDPFGSEAVSAAAMKSPRSIGRSPTTRRKARSHDEKRSTVEVDVISSSPALPVSVPPGGEASGSLSASMSGSPSDGGSLRVEGNKRARSLSKRSAQAYSSSPVTTDAPAVAVSGALDSPRNEITLSDGDIKELGDILDDSPAFRERVKHLEGEVEARSAKLRKIVKASREFQKAGQAYRDAVNAFSGELFSFPVACGMGGIDETLQQSMSEFGTALQDINEYHAMMFVQLGNVFTHPLESFLKDNLKQAKEEAKLHNKAQGHYDTVFSKMMHVKKGDAEKLQDLEPELLMARQLYQVSSIDLVARLKEAKAQTEIELFDKTSAFLYAHKAYFQQGSALCHRMETTLATVSHRLHERRDDLEEDRERILHLKRRQAQMAAGAGDSDSSKQTNINGYLFQARKGIGKGWKKRYVEVRDGMIFGYKSGKESAPVPLFNLLLCTVKPATDIDRRYCFEIVSPQESYVMQAETAEEMMKWMLVIQNATALALNSQSSRGGDAVPKSDSESSTNKHLALEIAHKDPSNRECADCKTPDPDWASINLGVTICIQCSGIHRNLGTHISKVRSLTLDVWASETIKVVCGLGNAKVNEFFEANVPADVSRLTPQSDRAEREDYINRKYVRQEFAAAQYEGSSEDRAERFLLAASNNDMLGMLQYIRHGGHISTTGKDAEQQSALHLAALHNKSGMCEFLLQNGAEANVVDANLMTPLHHAALLDHVSCAIVLIKHGAKLDLRNTEELTPLDIAVKNERAHCVTLLRLASHAQAEHPGNALKHESFQQALQMFSTDLEDVLNPPETREFWTAEDSDGEL